MKWYGLLSQLRPSPIHFAVFLRMCTSQPLCLCRIVGSSQTPGVFHAGGGQSHNRRAKAFSQRTAEGWDRVAWLHLNVCKTKSRNLGTGTWWHLPGQRMNSQQSLTTTRIRTSRKTSLTGQGFKEFSLLVTLGHWVTSCRHNCWPVRIEAGVTSKEMKEKQQKT